MGLIDYTSLEDGTPITANIFNERFGQIVSMINGGLDQNNFASGGIPKAALASDVYEQIYPIGSLYFNATDNTNPSEILGFGTWAAFGAGKVPVGYDATDTDFNAAEKTGGEKTHVLSSGELASHTHVQNAHGHGISDPGHSHSFTRDPVVTSATGNARAYLGGSGQQFAWSALGLNGSGTGVSVVGTTATNQNTGSNTAHNNLQPFIAVYIWKRTA